MSVSVACGVAAVLVSLVSALGWLLGRPPDFLLHQPGHQPALHAAERVESLVRRIRAPMLPKCRRVTVLRGIAVRIRVTDPAGQAGAEDLGHLCTSLRTSTAHAVHGDGHPRSIRGIGALPPPRQRVDEPAPAPEELADALTGGGRHSPGGADLRARGASRRRRPSDRSRGRLCGSGLLDEGTS